MVPRGRRREDARTARFEGGRRTAGKHKAVFTPHVDTGDFVVVINAGRVHLTGKKETEKVYYRHTNYPGASNRPRSESFAPAGPRRSSNTPFRGCFPRTSSGAGSSSISRCTKEANIRTHRKRRNRCRYPEGADERSWIAGKRQEGPNVKHGQAQRDREKKVF